MSKVYFSATVNEDGTLVVPAFAVRGMGFKPNEEVAMSVPVEQPVCGLECGCNELFIGRCCGESDCGGYTSDGSEVNIPARMLAKASLPVGTEVHVITRENALVLVAGANIHAGLADEVQALLEELGMEDAHAISLECDF